MTSRVLVCVGLIVGPGAVVVAGQPETFLKTHCVDCHGPVVQEAGLRVDQLPGDLADPEAFARWVRLFDRIESRELTLT